MWAGNVPQTGAGTQVIPPVTDGPSATSAASVVPEMIQAVAPLKCNWTEHTSPDGYKYYYNSTTGESKVKFITNCNFYCFRCCFSHLMWLYYYVLMC